MKLTLTVSTWCFMHGQRHADPRPAIAEIRGLGMVPELWLNWDGEATFYDRANWDGLRGLIGPSPAMSFHTRNDRERMFEEVELLGFLGGRVLVVHPCVLSLPEQREEWPDVPFVRELAAAARQHGVFLGLENIFGRAFLDRTLEKVETFDARGGLGICIDLGHAELRRDEPAEAAGRLIRDYGKILLHLHVHDVLADPAGQPRDHQPLGSGFVDYAAIARALREADFAGTAALEIISPDPVAMVRQSLAYLRRAFGADLTVASP